MNATFRTVAGLLIGAASVVAGPPATRVVVLDNENLIEGEVTEVAGGYDIRRPAGGDMTVPAARVLAVVADRQEAYAVVLRRANRHDADEHLRVARWCSSNDLPDEALAEARTAARMRPGFAAAERYVRTLDLEAQLRNAQGSAVAKPKLAPAGDTVTDVPALDYNSESFPLFATKVNAVLLNTCANCHARDDVKPFHLTRVSGRGGVSRNLMAALPHVNPADPAKSPILLQAVAAHGGATEPPIRTRTHPAYQTLETWVRIARAAEGTATAAPPPAATNPSEPRKLPDLPPGKPTEAFGQDSKTVPPRPTKTAASDPFDPAIFNGEVKPRK